MDARVRHTATECHMHLWFRLWNAQRSALEHANWAGEKGHRTWLLIAEETPPVCSHSVQPHGAHVFISFDTPLYEQAE